MRECFWDIGEIARRAANLPVDDRVAAWQAIQRKTRAWLAEFQTPEVWEGYAYLPTALTAVPPGLEDIARIAREAFQFEEGHGVLAEVALLHYMNSAAGEHLRFFPDADGSETSSLFTIDADGSEAGSARFERGAQFVLPVDEGVHVYNVVQSFVGSMEEHPGQRRGVGRLFGRSALWGTHRKHRRHKSPIVLFLLLLIIILILLFIVF